VFLWLFIQNVKLACSKLANMAKVLRSQTLTERSWCALRCWGIDMTQKLTYAQENVLKKVNPVIQVGKIMLSISDLFTLYKLRKKHFNQWGGSTI
jgi:hypothetical protein